MTVRVAALLWGALLGLVSGVLAVLLHQSWLWLLLALVAAAATMRALGPGGARILYALGWAVVVLRGTLPTPAGDWLVLDNARGWTLLIGSFVLVLVAFATAGPRGRTDGVHEGQPPSS